MNLRHLAIFHAIARRGSVNAAAEHLHTSQPAVSRELRTLEERLGVVLFDRLPRGMRLTEAGQVLLDYADRIFTLDQAAERAMHELANLESGHLAIGASNTLGTYLLPALLAAFHTRYPGIELSLEVTNTEHVVEGVRGMRYALGFVEGRGEEARPARAGRGAGDPARARLGHARSGGRGLRPPRPEPAPRPGDRQLRGGEAHGHGRRRRRLDLGAVRRRGAAQRPARRPADARAGAAAPAILDRPARPRAQPQR